MTNIFAGIGIGTTMGVGLTLLILVVNVDLDAIDKAVWVHKYRHRFDKPPTAACYCVDCKFHGDPIDPTRCTNHQDIIFRTADEWYCQAAEPKERNCE